jgi:dTDP-glucose 4,6-dehydratase
MINNALAGKSLPVYGSGKNVRDWLYVVDHAKAIDLVAEQGKVGEIYNVGGHNEKKNIEIVTTIIDTLLEILPLEDDRRNNVSRDLITYVEDRKGHDFRYAIAPDKIKTDLGWEPETPFAQGIKLTIAWYLNHIDWMEHVTKGDYQKYYNEMYQV